MDFERLRALLAALERERVRYAVFGAVALNAHGFARFTLKDRADAELLKRRFDLDGI